jgi:hypothetical protein
MCNSKVKVQVKSMYYIKQENNVNGSNVLTSKQWPHSYCWIYSDIYVCNQRLDDEGNSFLLEMECTFIGDQRHSVNNNALYMWQFN